MSTLRRVRIVSRKKKEEKDERVEEGERNRPSSSKNVITTRTIHVDAQGKEKRVYRSHAPHSHVPLELQSDPLLLQSISALPSNYNFEVPKTIHRIRTSAAKTVALQLPEGAPTALYLPNYLSISMCVCICLAYIYLTHSHCLALFHFLPPPPVPRSLGVLLCFGRHTPRVHGCLCVCHG